MSWNYSFEMTEGGHAPCSCGTEGEHPLDVPRQGDQVPLSRDLLEAVQAELAEPHNRFDGELYAIVPK